MQAACICTWWQSVLQLLAEASRQDVEYTAVEDLVRRTIRSLVMNTQDMPDGKAASGMSVAAQSSTWTKQHTEQLLLLYIPVQSPDVCSHVLVCWHRL